MSRFLLVVVGVALCWGLVPRPAYAAEGRSWLVELLVLRIPAAESALGTVRITGRADLRRLVRDGRVQLLETVCGLGTLNESLTLLAGCKVPLGYVEPRCGGYQVQYVDSGLKAYVTITSAGPQGFVVSAQGGKSGLGEQPHGFPYQLGMRVATRFPLQASQVALFASTRGRFSSQAFELAYPGVTFAEGDTIVFGLAVSAP